MKPKVYIETTIISYLTGKPSRDIIIAAHQQITEEWWQTRRHLFDLYASQLVIREAGAGDEEYSQKRLNALSEAELLEITESALSLAKTLIEKGAVPQKAAEDALHIAIAAVNGIDYFISWNCKHIANAKMRSKIEQVCLSCGYEPIIICTPEELLED
ncbi:MAG TPA: type II toxin-antitoxin system VapC family toxin [Candidatus Deferrimicrobium sp.]|nr:type II toxin-antitoxin system VapC family toxin [Candidatus Deferrimicrobium sp.]